MKGYALKGITCESCKKNPAKLTFVESASDYAHGFGKKMCKECYDNMVKESHWYKQGYEDAIEWIRDIIRLSGDDLKKIKERIKVI